MSLLHPVRALRQTVRRFLRFVRVVTQLFRLIGPGMRYSMLSLQLFNVVGSISSLLSTLSIVPFLAMIMQPERTQSNRWVRMFQDALNIETQEMLVVALGVTSVLALTLSHGLNIFLAVLQWRLQDYLKLSVFDKMTKHYFSHDYEFYLQEHSAVLLKNMLSRAESIINSLMQSVFRLAENVIFIVLGVVLIFASNPYLALPIVLLMFTSLAITIQRNRDTLKHHTQTDLLRDSQGGILSLDALHSMESIQISGRWRYFSDRTWEHRRQQIRHQRAVGLISMLFKPILEVLLAAIIVGSIIITVLFVGDSLRTLVSLAVFGLVAYRIAPRIITLWNLYVEIQRGMINFDFMGEDLILAFKRSFPPRPTQRMPYKKSLRLENLCYAYPKTAKNAVDGLSLEIPRGASVGICGNTGSGKSTLVKLILGLLRAQSGRILVDGVEVDRDNLPTWQNLTGYVSQSNTLLSVDFLENIALGVPPEKIDKQRVRRVLKEAELHDFVKSLSSGMRTPIGERGQRLSGGQAQRVAIARALYNDPEVLIFDEATSSLDNITERSVVDTIYNLSKEQRTLIMVAHRLSTIQRCDFLVLMEAGKIVAQGPYEELLENDPKFRELAADYIEEEEEELAAMSDLDTEITPQQASSPGTKA